MNDFFSWFGWNKQETTGAASSDYEKLKAQWFSDEFLSSKWIKDAKNPKSLKDVNESLWIRWAIKSGKETMDNLPYNPNKLLPNPSEMVRGMARGGVELLWNTASFLTKYSPTGYLSDKITGAITGKDVRAKRLKWIEAMKSATDSALSWMKSFDRSVGLNPDSLTAKVWEFVWPVVPSAAAGNALYKMFWAIPKLKKIIDSSKLARVGMHWAAGLAETAAGSVAATGEAPSVAQLGVWGAVSAVIPWLWALAGRSKSIMKYTWLSNITSRKDLGNMIKRIGAGEKILEEWDIAAATEATNAWLRKLWAKTPEEGVEIVNNMLMKYSPKGGTTQEVIEQLGAGSKWLMGTVDDDLRQITLSSVAPKVGRESATDIVLSTANKTPSSLSETSRATLEKFTKIKDWKAIFQQSFTPVELQAIKRLSDDMGRIYKPWGDTMGSAIARSQANARQAIKESIEKSADDFGVPDIARRNQEVQILQWLKQSAEEMSLMKYLGNIFDTPAKRVMWGVSFGTIAVAGYAGGQALGSDSPSGNLIIAAAAVAAIAALGRNSKLTNNIARNIFKRISPEEKTILESYLTNWTGVKRAKKIAEKMEVIAKKLAREAKNIKDKARKSKLDADSLKRAKDDMQETANKNKYLLPEWNKTPFIKWTWYLQDSVYWQSSLETGRARATWKVKAQ